MTNFMEVINRGECVKYMQLAIDQLRAENAGLKRENERLVDEAWRTESLASDARLREDGE